MSNYVPVSGSVVTRPGNGSVFLRACFPLVLMFLVAVGYGVTMRLSRALVDPQLGAMRRSEAFAFSEALCARVAGVPAEAVQGTGYTNTLQGDAHKLWHEWRIRCQAGGDQYTCGINADRRELLSIYREGMPGAMVTSGKVLGEAEQAVRGRRYLALVGLPVQARFLVRSQHGSDFMYRVAYRPSGLSGNDGQMNRLLRVCLDPEDGSLVALVSSTSRK